ncbi:4Fe-4S dicluster domain-containing protein [Desulfovibrio inopinatus]|uniref:4Fe-4S dicluster domain-containing protein n=1 Tax=Desulfovibrio inopinatus TaxID=102109 RepID=UPI00041E5539|nr:4Fe-4S dicluster domain-containing protein [Desulfovibrio inopinatus]
MHVFVLADPARCIGCRACEIACVAAHMKHDMGQAMEDSLPFSPRLTLIREAGVTAPIQCRQCEDAPCAAACPTGAVTSNGRVVTITSTLCCGCKACLAVCPVGAMQIGLVAGEHALPVAYKCDLCSGHDTPACVAVCPADALRVFTKENLQHVAGSRRQQSARQLAEPGYSRET